MRAWEDVVAAVRARYEMAIERSDWCGLVTDVDGRRQKIALAPARESGAIVLTAQVCAHVFIDPIEALQYNSVVEGAILGLERDVFVLRRVLALHELDEKELTRAIDEVALEAARLHRTYTPRHQRDDLLASCFGYWT
jgi:hypothetical protein